MGFSHIKSDSRPARKCYIEIYFILQKCWKICAHNFFGHAMTKNNYLYCQKSTAKTFMWYSLQVPVSLTILFRTQSYMGIIDDFLWGLWYNYLTFEILSKSPYYKLIFIKTHLKYLTFYLQLFQLPKLKVHLTIMNDIKWYWYQSSKHLYII